MSKQTSLLTFEGKMGNISFFKSKGQHRARLAGGGLSKERIQKDPKLSRVRENNQEFGAMAMMGKSFRRATSKVKFFQDTELSARLIKVFTVMKKRSVTTRGQRPILLSENRALLAGLEFSTSQAFVDVFSAPFTFSHDSTRNVATFTVTNLNVRETVLVPPSATHFRIVHALGFVSDTIFAQDTDTYAVANEALNGMNEVAFSDYIPVNSPQLSSVSVQAVIPAQPTADVTVLQSVGILFYENIGTEYYALSQGKAMRVIDLF
jgi:hypothetical protein